LTDGKEAVLTVSDKDADRKREKRTQNLRNDAKAALKDMPMLDDLFDTQSEYEAIQLGFILGAVDLVCPPCLRYYAGRYVWSARWCSGAPWSG
jgi:hypothetical protein